MAPLDPAIDPVAIDEVPDAATALGMRHAEWMACSSMDELLAAAPTVVQEPMTPTRADAFLQQPADPVEDFGDMDLLLDAPQPQDFEIPAGMGRGMGDMMDLILDAPPPPHSPPHSESQSEPEQPPLRPAQPQQRQGRWQRSRGFLKFLTRTRSEHAEYRKKTSTVIHKFSKLAKLWTKTSGLRAAEKPTLETRRYRGLKSRHVLKQDGQHHRALHPNQWSLPEALIKCWQQVGGRSLCTRQRTSEVGEIHGGRGLFALSTFAGVAQTCQDANR